jgi:hypothetical protein
VGGASRVTGLGIRSASIGAWGSLAVGVSRAPCVVTLVAEIGSLRRPHTLRACEVAVEVPPDQFMSTTSDRVVTAP